MSLSVNESNISLNDYDEIEESKFVFTQEEIRAAFDETLMALNFDER